MINSSRLLAICFVMGGCSGTRQAPPPAEPTPHDDATAPVSPSEIPAAEAPAAETPVAGAAAEASVAPAAEPKLLASFEGLELAAGYNGHRHTHGGSAARIGHLRLNARATGTARRFSVEQLTLLRAHCRSEDWDSRNALVLTNLLVESEAGGDAVSITTEGLQAELPSDNTWYALTIGFEAVQAYQACDRFGIELGYRVGDPAAPVHTIVVPIEVVRMEPMRVPAN